jgi:SsrA-binding protein
MNKIEPNQNYYKNIVDHRRARFEYTIEDTYEAGIALLGWEIKSIRANRINFDESYCIIRHGEVFWIGGHISPLANVASYIKPDPLRSRKLLLKNKEIQRLIGAIERQGYTLIPLSLYWKNHLIKIKIGLAKGKKTHDKRQAIKEREWQRSNRSQGNIRIK